MLKQLGHVVGHWPPASTKVKNDRSCTYYPPSIFSPWCLIKHIFNFKGLGTTPHYEMLPSCGGLAAV